jgi:tetratricopeptide (TPR) repeat protein
MRAPAAALAALALPALLLAPAGLRAQEGPAGDAAVAAAAVERGLRAFEAGRYADAEAMLAKAASDIGDLPAAAAAHEGLSRVLEETGRLAEALAAARRAAALDGDARFAVRVGTLEAATGDLDGAERTLRAAAASAPDRIAPAAALGELLRGRGRRKEALEWLLRANGAWASGTTEETEEVLAAARARFAAIEMDPGFRGQTQSTFDLLAGPLRARDADAAVLTAWFWCRNDHTEKVPDALRGLLARNPLHPGALAVAAWAKEARFEGGEAADLARRALSTDPTHPLAVEVLALLRYSDGDEKGAAAVVKRALAARPKERVLLALDAIPRYLDGGTDAFEKALEPVRAVDPTFGRGWEYLSRILEDRRRFAEAAEAARRAVALDPSDTEAWFSLGRNELNLGREKEAREALAKADATDPWRSIFRSNFLTVLEELEGYAASGTKHFQVLIHPAEEAVLRRLYEPALEASLADLRRRYGFDPEVPILVEVFRRANDFSARTLGIPGFSAVGACFGRVVTLDSPSALPAGAFCWRATLHHELAHVFHLQMTRGRVPRWFTEGLATHEEARARPSWIRNMDRELVSAIANGEVKGLAAIDAAFREDVQWAYYQSGLMLGWIEREFGWEKVLAMLRAYGDGASNEEAVRGALGLDPAAFDARFLEHCRARTAGWRVRPDWSDRRLAEFRARAEKDAKDLEAHLLLAECRLQRGNAVDAGASLARARAAGATEEDGLFLALRARLALATLKSPDRGLDLLRRALARGFDDHGLRMTLGAVAEKEGDLEGALEHWRVATVLFPRSPEPRGERARVLNALGRSEEAVAELEAVAAIGESEIRARLDLAGVFEGRGDAASAARVLGEVVDICPVPGDAPPKRPSEFPAAQVHARLARALLALARPAAAADSFALAAAVGRGYEPKEAPAVVAQWLVEQAKAGRAAGREEEARRALRDAVRTDPGNLEAAELLRALGDG